MPVRPTAPLLSWATSEANRETPSPGLRVIGWLGNEIIPSLLVNGLFGNLFEWMSFAADPREDVVIYAGLLQWRWYDDFNALQEGSGVLSELNVTFNNHQVQHRNQINGSSSGTLTESATDSSPDQIACQGVGKTSTVAADGTESAVDFTELRMYRGNVNGVSSSDFTARLALPNMFRGGTVESITVAVGTLVSLDNTSNLSLYLTDSAGTTQFWLAEIDNATSDTDVAMVRSGSAVELVGSVTASMVLTLSSDTIGAQLEIGKITLEIV